MEDWIRSKKEVVNVNNDIRTRNYPFLNKEATHVPTQADAIIAVKQLALANDLYGNLKRTPSPPPTPRGNSPRRDYPQVPYDFRLTF